MSTAPDNELKARNLRLPAYSNYGTIGNRWAVIVGISLYKYERLNLQYAHRDAEELYELLQKPSGGGFEPARIKKLINEEATTAAVSRALRSFLKQPAREDLVLLYFACHGAPDPDRPQNLYLITHDTDPDDIAGSALPMREIDQSLNETLLAERKVVIADTCHSAAISGHGRRGVGNDAQVINAYLKEASEAKGGVALLTSAEASEVSQEGQQWGGGHGVFTHFVLEGMRGDADGYVSPKDGKITARELFEYVRDNVIKATKNKQHPAIGNYAFDPNLPMAITGGIDAQMYFELGKGLYELGCRLDDLGRFRSAARQFDEAIQLSRITGEDFPEAELWLAKALAMAGDNEKAIKVLTALLDRGASSVTAEALLNLGMANAHSGDAAIAIRHFEEFLGQASQHENAAWVHEYVEELKKTTNGRRYALLIGINRYQLDGVQLFGCVNDVHLMKEALAKNCGFADSDILILLDQAATRDGISNAFSNLASNTRAADTVIVYYSGQSIPQDDSDSHSNWGKVYLIVHDTTDKERGISYIDLHRMMTNIHAECKTLILDTNPNIRFNKLVEEEAEYSLLVASDPSSESRELNVGGSQVGAFTWALSRHLSTADPATMTYGQLIDASFAEMPVSAGKTQMPLFLGDREQLVFARNIHSLLFKFALRQNYEAYALIELKARYSSFKRRIAMSLSQVHSSFGRAFLEKEDYRAAIEPLQTALQQGGSDVEVLTFALGKAQFGAGLYQEAIQSFQRYADLISGDTVRVGQLIERVKRLAMGRKHGLLVGINQYINPDVKRVHGAVNDAKALCDVLLSKFGFKSEDVKVLLDGDATRDMIITEFKQLVEAARTGPAVFFFAGNGSMEAVGNAPTLVSADGRQDGVLDISISELAKLAKSATNLVTILDAGWTTSRQKNSENLRTISADQTLLGFRNIAPPPEPVQRLLDDDRLRIGAITIYSANAIKYIECNRDLIVEADTKNPPAHHDPTSKPTFRGLLTSDLVRALEVGENQPLNYEHWLKLAAAPYSVADQLVIFGDRLNDPVFDNGGMRAEILFFMRQIERDSINQTITILKRILEQREQQSDTYPEGRLNLGIAYAAKGDFELGSPFLERAVALYTDPTIMEIERERDPYAELHYHDSHYQLGRFLLASERDFTRAVSELKEAVGLEPENARAYFYLGQAIRAMVEHETLARAEDALKIYLSKGAPLGHEEEVRKFLGSRRKKEAS